MTITETTENGTITLALDGRLDTNTALQLEEALKPVFDKTKEIILNFSKLTFISSAGLRVLLIAMKTAKEKSLSITITEASADVMDIFEVTGFAKILNIK